MTDRELLTIPEAADFLRLQPSTIRSWVSKRKLPHVKMGGRVLLRRGDLQHLVVKSYVPSSKPEAPLPPERD